MSAADWAHLVNWTCLALLAVVPFWAVIRLKGMGVLPAAAFVWLIGYLHHPAMGAFRPIEMGPYYQVLWMVGGWLWGLLYVGVLYWLVQLFGVFWQLAQVRITGIERDDPTFDMTVSWDDDDEYEGESSLRYYIRAYLRRLPRLHPAEVIGLLLIAAISLALLVIAWHPWK